MRIVVEDTGDSMTAVEPYFEGEPELCIVQHGSSGLTQNIVFQSKESAIKAAMALLEFSGWLPMSTAPKNERILVKSGDELDVVCYNEEHEHWHSRHMSYATKCLDAWLPLPKREGEEEGK